MTTNVYEGLFILDSDQYARNPEGISGQVDKFIAQYNGEILVSRLWEERKLAYPIKGHRRGTYWLTYFRLDPANVKDLTRQFQISDEVIRFIFIKVEPRLVDTLVEHAKAERIRPISEDQLEEGASEGDLFDESVDEEVSQEVV